ncbi:MAG: 2-amino-4-hydroxy-6-hydroxymethyldihydropteridine diphosphokinase [Actinobacteria bacterium]|nr:MAG: 2-amino-4-hydroxy-6-hydroxymethyldihydropteridine diphosphokinase [Actinomycetota bacterium]
MRAFLALGSNLGDRGDHLRTAVDGLPDIVRRSSVYETAPVGGPDAQGAYLNMVVQLDTELGPRALLDACRQAEAEGGRERNERWGPRTIDVDIVWIDGVNVAEPDLQIPHPRMSERAFVLAPLEELAADVVPLGWRDALGDDGVVCLGDVEDAPP